MRILSLSSLLAVVTMCFSPGLDTSTAVPALAHLSASAEDSASAGMELVFRDDFDGPSGTGVNRSDW
ncbi:hypothetical protein ACFVJ2_48405, partial [Rhodococcus jostii]